MRLEEMVMLMEKIKSRDVTVKGKETQAVVELETHEHNST